MKSAGVIMLCTLLTFTVRAQQSGQMPIPAQPESPQFFFYEAINFVDEDSAASRVDIPYRIDNQFFIAVKNTDQSFPFPFKRRGEILIELLDKKGISKARDIKRFTIGASTTESPPDEKQWYQGIASFSVSPGEYTIVFELDDLESERTFLERSKKVVAARFDGKTFVASTPVFVQRVGGDTLTLQNFGSNIGFGSSASLFLELHSNALTSDPVRVEYTISTQQFLLQDPKIIATDTLAQLPLLQQFWPVVNQAENAPPSYTLSAPEILPHTSAVIIPLGAEKLPLRPFVLDLKITQGALTLTMKTPFRMVWPEMPASLRDIDFALEALLHITREEELDSLTRGSRIERLRHLEEFWKRKDRTPDTDYNEVMVAYYRRVDYTIRAFSSMKGADGYKSDRGRIYILYGPPTKAERSLDPAAGFLEVWTYEKHNMKFVFRDQAKSGNYTLETKPNL